METTLPAFRAPSASEQVFNRIFGFLVGLGLCPSYCYLLEVRGRKSGRIYATPVSLLEFRNKRYLVAPRGRTQWVRNAEASGKIVLRRRSQRQEYTLQPISGEEKLAVLKEYLDRYRGAVQRFFTVPAGSPPQAFASVAEGHPAFELLPV
jgi:deazaflavin-dependent oxidoreductase (nitroreductase family)